MANASVAQAVSHQTVAVALRQAHMMAAEHKAGLQARNRAVLNRETAPWPSPAKGSGLPARRRPALHRHGRRLRVQHGSALLAPHGVALLRTAAELVPPAARPKRTKTRRAAIDEQVYG